MNSIYFILNTNFPFLFSPISSLFNNLIVAKPQARTLPAIISQKLVPLCLLLLIGCQRLFSKSVSLMKCSALQKIIFVVIRQCLAVYILSFLNLLYLYSKILLERFRLWRYLMSFSLFFILLLQGLSLSTLGDYSLIQLVNDLSDIVSGRI